MKEGDRVVIINPDSSFYKMSGIVIKGRVEEEDSRSSPFVSIFITEKKKAYYFTVYDCKAIEV